MQGIYKIECLVNGKIYVGQSINVQRRLSDHRASEHNSELREDMQKMGLSKFTFELLEEVPLEKLTEREQYFIDLFDSLNPQKGYNKRTAGPKGPLSEDHKKRISEALKGKKKSPEHNAKMQLSRLGRKHKPGRDYSKLKYPKTEEHKRKLSESEKGKLVSYETRMKMRKPHQKHSEECEPFSMEENRGT